MRANKALYVTIGVVSTVLLGTFIALSVVIGEDFAVPAMVMGGVVTAVALRGPVGRALAEWIRGEGAALSEPHPELLAELDEMRTRLAEVDEVRTRMAELEERVDFSERLLTKVNDEAGRLPRG
jgi:hypothetical protein